MLKRSLESIMLVAFISLSACSSGPTNVDVRGPINVNTTIPFGNDAIQAASKVVSGEVTSVNQETGEFKVKNENGTEETLKVEPSELSLIQAGKKVRIISDNKKTKVDIDGKGIDAIIITGNTETDIKIRNSDA